MSGSVLLLVISIVLLVLCIGAAAVSVFFIIIKRTRGSAGADVCCPSCGAKQRAGTKFCAECGAQLPANMQAFCTECGTRFEGDMAFCPNCGKPAQAAASAPAPAKRSKAPIITACASVVMMIPLIVLIAVSSADSGEINIAIKIGTCAVRVAVNAGGSVMRRKPNAVGIMIPNAISSAVITIFFVLNLFM